MSRDLPHPPCGPCPLHPIANHITLSPGLVSTDKESVAHILSRKGGGNLVGITIGGIKEALKTRPGTNKLVLRNRKGFARLALMHGYWAEGSGFSWRLARIVFWWEDSIRSSFSKRCSVLSQRG